jgi:alkylated DNA repair dioxygenase AlkB
VDVSSRPTELGRLFPGLCPFGMGPVTMYPGARALPALTAGNAFEHAKLYAAHADPEGDLTEAHASWMCEGARAHAPRFPPSDSGEHLGADLGFAEAPLCAVWRDRRLGCVEARLLIYIPLYVEALCRDPEARAAYGKLRALRAAARAAGTRLALFDNTGYDCEAAGLTLEQAAAAPGWATSHALVLAALLEDRLVDVVRGAAALAGLEAPPARGLPTDLSPLREAEELPGLVGGAVVYYRPRFLNHAADRYFELLRPGGESALPWERRLITVYGRPCKEGHDTVYFGDPGTSYRYSGKGHAPLPWSADATGALTELRELVRLVGGQPFNFCLGNFYRPADSIGAHSDDERDLVAGSSIFSISLGRARRFCMEPKGGRGARGAQVSQRLAHGSALVMAGLTQKAYKHRIDAEKMRTGEGGPADRVNLTFRCVAVR